MAEGYRRYPWYYALFLMGYYMANAVYQGFISVYYKGIGLSTSQIGILMGAVPLVSILTQPFWGSLGDRMKNRNRLLRVLCLAAALTILCFRFSDQYLFLLLMLSLYAGFFTSIQPMGDSIILEAIAPRRVAFGPLRYAGCLAFAFCSILAGRVLEGDMYLILYLTAGLLIATLFATYALPPMEGHQKKGDKTSMLEIFRLKGMGQLLMFVTLLQLTMGYYYSFFPVYFTSLPGGSTSLLGWCYFISAVSETPFLLLSDKLFEKLGVGKLLLIAALTQALRWALLSRLQSVPFVMAAQLLHGWGFIIMTVAMSKYVNLTVPPALKARGQMLLSIVGFGFARVAGNLGGGFLADAIGIQGGFFVTALVALLAFLLFAPKYLRMGAITGAQNP